MSKIPRNYPTITPYLIVNNAPGFIHFLQDVFSAELKDKHMRDEQKIKHAELKIGNSMVMLADSTEQYPPVTASLFVYVEEADDAYKKAIYKGSTIVTELSYQSYGRSGGIKDPFGNIWWITSLI